MTFGVESRTPTCIRIIFEDERIGSELNVLVGVVMIDFISFFYHRKWVFWPSSAHLGLEFFHISDYFVCDIFRARVFCIRITFYEKCDLN